MYNRHTTDKQPAEVVEASPETAQSGTTETARMNAPTTSFGGKVTKKTAEKQEESSEIEADAGSAVEAQKGAASYLERARGAVEALGKVEERRAESGEVPAESPNAPVEESANDEAAAVEAPPESPKAVSTYEAKRWSSADDVAEMRERQEYLRRALELGTKEAAEVFPETEQYESERKVIRERFDGKIPEAVAQAFAVKWKDYFDRVSAVHGEVSMLTDAIVEAENNAKHAAELAARQQNDERLKQSYNGFLAGRSKLVASRMDKALSKRVNIAGEVSTIAAYIEAQAANGTLAVRTQEYGTGDKLKTQYLVNSYDLGKTAYDYAVYLLEKQGQGSTLQWSEEKAANGEPFLLGKNGSIDLVEIPDEVFAAMGIERAPFRLTPSMVSHVYNRHKQELNLGSEQDAVDVIVDVMTNFDHVRRGKDNTFVFSIEEGRNKTAKRAVTIVLQYEDGKWIGIKTVGLDRVKSLNELATLWGKGESPSSTAGVATANVSSAQPSEGDRVGGIASNQNAANTAGKVSEKLGDMQEVGGENGEKGSAILQKVGREAEVGDVVRVAEADEVALVEALTERIGAAGIEVVRDGDEGQRVLDAANGGVRWHVNGESVSRFFHNAAEGKITGKSVAIGRLTAAGKRYLESISGITLRDYVDFVLNPSDCRHIINGHYGANEKDKGNNVPLTDADLDNLQYVLSSPDKVVFGVDRRSGRKMFYFLKDAGDGTYNLAEVYADSRGNLRAKTFYKTKKSSAQREHELMNNSRLSTSETAGASSFVGAKIPKIFESASGRLQKVYHDDSVGDRDKEYLEAVENGDIDKAQHVRFFRTKDGEAYGFTVGGKIYLDPRYVNAETPIHEYAHLWAEALRRGNAKEWGNVVELMRGTPVWDEVREQYPELRTDDEIADEVLAQYSGRRGAERLREEMRKAPQQAAGLQSGERRAESGEGSSVLARAKAVSVLERVRLALERFWRSVADFLHIHYTSAEEVADRVLGDLLSGVNPLKSGEWRVESGEWRGT